MSGTSISKINQQGNGGGSCIKCNIGSGSSIQIEDQCLFQECISELGNGGAIQSTIDGGQIELSGVIFEECSGQDGGAIYSIISSGGTLTIKESCQFINCTSQYGNGGGIYINIDFAVQSFVSIEDCILTNCSAIDSTPQSQNPNYKGFGGGIFLIVSDNYNPTSNGIDFHGAKFYSNSATNYGQNLFVISSKLQDLCKLGNLGEYIKGNYDDDTSFDFELVGIPLSFGDFPSLSLSDIVNNKKYLERYWKHHTNLIWHVQFNEIITNDHEQGIDQQECGWYDDPCQTIEYALKQISLKMTNDENQNYEQKNIGISKGGYEILQPILINPSLSKTNKLSIMKQLYGNQQSINEQGQLIIKKNSNDNKEIGKDGWISVEGLMNLSIYSIDITTNQTTLQIPIIYIKGNQAILELDSVSFQQIQISPISNALGIIFLDDNIISIKISNTTFENIIIEGSGGNAIRIQNSDSTQNAFNIIITNSTFKNINDNGLNINNKIGGSAIQTQLHSRDLLEMKEYCLFEQCVCNQGYGGAMNIILNGGILNIKQTTLNKCTALNGGAIYISVTSMLEFLIQQEVYFEECEAIGSGIAEGRGGGLYINFEKNAPYEFRIGTDTHFINNEAIIIGRDIFIYCESIDDLDPDLRLLIYITRS
ncbi:MAG: hypothetical protein EZS28_038708 [Streblomastix strix]|uniref:Right handed beta helix domain-containing protein n=1 Tax=Streblomastix strix TaxID=222440 RepID=A0A5J4U7P2_9EUKA|nr:MAG: hypothetical protein EZS28_038708 [Streblomastix strix]